MLRIASRLLAVFRTAGEETDDAGQQLGNVTALSNVPLTPYRFGPEVRSEEVATYPGQRSLIHSYSLCSPAKQQGRCMTASIAERISTCTLCNFR